MSLINRLIHEAKLGATVLNIKPNEVRKVAEHCRACMLDAAPVETIEGIIRRGQLKLCDVPVKVLGMSKRCDVKLISSLEQHS
jgi:hypothetical protein